jgi:transposase
MLLDEPSPAAAASQYRVFDLDRQRVVEVLDGRGRRQVERCLRALPEQRRRAIEVVSIDTDEAPPPGDPQ